MSLRRWPMFGLGVAGGLLLARAANLYWQRPVERVAGPEALESRETAAAFAQVTRMPQMRFLRRAFIQRVLHLQDTGQAVDLGCGPGYLAIELAKAAPGLRVTGVDVSNQMLAEAHQNARTAGLAHRVSFRTADAASTPFSDGSVDLVVSTLSLHHWSEPVAVLDEVARVLRPGGAFVISDLRRDVGAPAYLLLWFATRFIVPAPLRRIGEPLGSRGAAYTPDEAVSLAQASRLAGWRIKTLPLWLVIEGKTVG